MPQPVVKTIDVPCPQDRAFDIFTRDINRWWPRDRHSVSAMDHGATAQAITLEPQVGGAITETGHDGTLHRWGTVTTFDPHDQLTLAWHINSPAEEATIVDIRFEPLSNGTRVTLSHHGWEVLGARAEAMRDGYDNGWVSVFETAYAAQCKAKAA